MSGDMVFVTVQCIHCGHECDGQASEWIDRPCPKCSNGSVISLDYLRDYHAKLTQMITDAERRRARAAKDDT